MQKKRKRQKIDKTTQQHNNSDTTFESDKLIKAKHTYIPPHIEPEIITVTRTTT